MALISSSFGTSKSYAYMLSSNSVALVFSDNLLSKSMCRNWSAVSKIRAALMQHIERRLKF